MKKVSQEQLQYERWLREGVITPVTVEDIAADVAWKRAVKQQADARQIVEPQKVDEESETEEERAERWQDEWGETANDAAKCQELDRIYSKLIADKPYLSQSAELQMHRVAVWTYECDRLMKKPTKESISSAKSIQSMIDQVLASEQLRKKDELPDAAERIDSLFDAMERSGFMKDGHILLYDELIEAIKVDNPQYPYTKDAADQCILIMRNCTMGNEGRPEKLKLAHNERILDVNGEFASEESEKEKQVKRDLNITKMPE